MNKENSMKQLKSKVILVLGICALTAFGIHYAQAAKTTFSDGNPAMSIKGTKVTAAFLNSVNKHFCTGLDVDGDCSLASATATGVNALVATITPTAYFPAAYVQNMPLYIKTSSTNTGPMTLNVNGIGAVEIKKKVNLSLSAGDITAGEILTFVYDGTNFQYFRPDRGTPATTISTGYTVTTSDMGSALVLNLASDATVTLPEANSVPAGSKMEIRTLGTGKLKLAGMFYNAASPTLLAKSSATIFSDGTNTWHGKFSFRGVLASNASFTATYTQTWIPWTTVSYDTDGIISVGTNTRLYIPNGVSKVRLGAIISFPASTGAPAGDRCLDVTGGGGESSIVCIDQYNEALQFNGWKIPVTTPVFDVSSWAAANRYFHGHVVIHTGGGNIAGCTGTIWMEIIE
jgi:hypothetical protein